MATYFSAFCANVINKRRFYQQNWAKNRNVTEMLQKMSFPSHFSHNHAVFGLKTMKNWGILSLRSSNGSYLI